MTPLLKDENLTAAFVTGGHPVPVLHGVSFDIAPGEAVGFVGESGSGKSVLARAVMRLAPETAQMRLGGRIAWQGRDLLALPERDMRPLRGAGIAMVFQDPMTSLNPTLSVGAQMDDMIRRHLGLSARAARARTVGLLEEVGIRNAATRADDYPHHFSGGMRQRVLIAMAISCDPDLLIADEPTTALDVTVQAQILRLMLRLREERKMAMMLISHDFGVIAGMVDRVNVMQHGRIVESGAIGPVLSSPSHPYTVDLLAAIPRLKAATDLQTTAREPIARNTADPDGPDPQLPLPPSRPAPAPAARAPMPPLAAPPSTAPRASDPPPVGPLPDSTEADR